PPRVPGIVRPFDPPPLDQKTCQTDQKYRSQYQQRFVGVDQLRRFYDQPARRGDSDADQHQRAENIDYERLEVEIERAAHDRKAEIVIEHDDRSRGGKNNETRVNESVKEARVSFANGPQLPQRRFEQHFHPRRRTIKRARRRAPPPHRYAPPDAVAGDDDRDDEHRVHHPNVGDVPEHWACGFDMLNHQYGATVRSPALRRRRLLEQALSA